MNTPRKPSVGLSATDNPLQTIRLLKLFSTLFIALLYTTTLYKQVVLNHKLYTALDISFY